MARHDADKDHCGAQQAAGCGRVTGAGLRAECTNGGEPGLLPPPNAGIREGFGSVRMIKLSLFVTMAAALAAAAYWIGAGVAASPAAASEAPAGAPLQRAGQPGAAHGGSHTSDASASQVNIVIFLIDTLRADRLGVYGYQRPTSPRIDALAGEAVVFEQAYAPAPWTLPTVVSLMTSRFPVEHRTLNDQHVLNDALEPLAQRLKRLGYTTLGLYANAYAGADYGLERGFDALKFSLRNGDRHVAALLDEHPGRPFFLYVHNTEPHTPHAFAPPHTDGFRDVPEQRRLEIQTHYVKYRRQTRVDFHKGRPRGTTDNTRAQQRELAALTAMKEDYSELYDAAVRLADTLLGSVVDLLKERGLWDDTLFIVLSDHGEEMNEHGGWLHDQSVYEELMHVPLVMHLPRGQHAGRRVPTVVSLVDVLPTIFDCLGAPQLAQDARGRSLLPLLDGQSPPDADDFCVPGMRLNRKKYYKPWKESRGDINIVVRRGPWKGIWNVEPQTLELYHLESDPGEQQDVSAANPELALAMRKFAQLWYEECESRALKPQRQKKPLDERTLENLRSLGYID